MTPAAVVVVAQAVQVSVVVLQTPSVPDPSAFDLQLLVVAHPVVVAHAPFWHVWVIVAQLSVAAGVESAPWHVSAKQPEVVVSQYMVASPPVAVA